ncbi:MAG: PAS domain S-box protein [Thermodesulfobacteriota bacterium]|nr:PAS domain S-box protein [Thermodesulfobacteriota bacterium]
MDKKPTFEEMGGKVALLEEKIRALEKGKEAHKENEDMFQKIADSNAAVIVIHNGKNILYANPATEKISGYTHDELLKINFWEIFEPESANLAKSRARARMKGEDATQSYEVELRSKDGILHHGDMRVRTLEFNGKPALIATIHDISDRIQRQEALRRSEEKFSKIFQTSPDCISITTLKEGLYLDVNDAFIRSTGYMIEEIIGRTSGEVKIWRFQNEQVRIVRKIERHGRVNNEDFELLTRSGAIRNMLFSAELIEFGGEPCILAVCRDITEHKMLQDQLSHTRKMEAIGRLAEEMGHDFKNILTVINGYSMLALHRTKGNRPAQKYLEKIHLAEEKASGMIAHLLAFSKKQVICTKIMDINRSIDDMKDLVGHLVGVDNLVMDLDPDCCTINADPGQIEQMILNLTLNARDAMDGTGRFLIQTSKVYLDSDRYPDVSEGLYTLLKITDTGQGMDEDTASMAFEPFFTTKKDARGAGLGLSTVYGIVKQNKGLICIESTPGKGTTINIHLPCA